MSQVDTNYQDRHRDIQREIDWENEDCRLLSNLSFEKFPYAWSLCGTVLIGKDNSRVKDNREKYRKARLEYDDSVKYDGYWDVMETIL